MAEWSQALGKGERLLAESDGDVGLNPCLGHDFFLELSNICFDLSFIEWYSIYIFICLLS